MGTKEDSLLKNNCFNRNHENVTAGVFGGSPFFDCRDIVQVKYEMVRAADNAEGTVADISRSFGFSRKSYYQINEAFQAGGLQALVPKKTGPKKPTKLTPEAAGFIESYLGNKPGAKSSEVSAALEAETGVRIHPRTIYRHLKKN
jgi:transposase